MQLSAPMEDYLEAIGQLCAKNGVARIKDIAAKLEVSMASVVGAMKSLKRKGLVEQEHYGYVSLTVPGSRAAQSIIHRHQVLSHFLEKILGLDRETASRDACRIEHAVGPETVKRLRAAAAFIESEAHDDLDWGREFRKFYRKHMEDR
jgi:DtxR family Mn-dependent transcriptional regulator